MFVLRKTFKKDLKYCYNEKQILFIVGRIA